MKMKKSHKMSRRTFLKALGAAGGMAATGIGFPAIIHPKEIVDRSKLVKEINFSTSGGIWGEAVIKSAIEPFSEKYGVKIRHDPFAGDEGFLAKLRASGPGAYHLVSVGETGMYMAVKQGLLETINLSNITNFDNLLEPFKKPLYDPGTKEGKMHGIAVSYGSLGVVYNYEMVKPKPDSWAVCWDKKYAKKVTMNDSAQYIVFATALYLGQNPNNIKDYDAIWKAVKEQRPLVLKYWASGTEAQQMYTNREVVAGQFWGGRARILHSQGVPVEYLVPKEGAITWLSDWVIPKGVSPGQKYTAEKIIDFALEPENAVRLSELCNYPSSLKINKYKVTDKIKNLPDFDPTGTLDRFKFVDNEYKEKHNREWVEKFNMIKMGG